MTVSKEAFTITHYECTYLLGLVQLQKLLNDQKDLTPQQQIIELQKQLSNLIGNPAVETVVC